LQWQVRPQSDFFSDEAEETGLTFIENAILKARFASEKTGLPAIADDSGLEVTALNGAPGIYSSRYAGPDASDAQNVEKLLNALEGVPKGERQASFYCAMVYVRFADDPTPIIGLGRWRGEIAAAPTGEGGFGYDPVFWIPALQQSAAQLSSDAKQKLSHRGQALRQLSEQLQAFSQPI
jgi:XTP/dITP diphosphohydrolase